MIISTGATAKRMGIPNEEKMWNNGMSACAVCDGALPMFRNQPLMVIGVAIPLLKKRAILQSLVQWSIWYIVGMH